jgi:hypothetical protein
MSSATNMGPVGAEPVIFSTVSYLDQVRPCSPSAPDADRIWCHHSAKLKGGL